MKIKLTVNPIVLCILISTVAILSSCSTSNQMSSTRGARYHPDLVKANNNSLSLVKKEKENMETAITSISHQVSLVSNQSNEQRDKVNSQLKTDIKFLTKEAKKSSPVIYNQIKTINLNKAYRSIAKNNSAISLNNKLSINNTNSMGGDHGYFGLFILFLLLALLFWILSVSTGLFGVLGLIASIAAVIFFILWIVSLAS